MIKRTVLVTVLFIRNRAQNMILIEPAEPQIKYAIACETLSISGRFLQKCRIFSAFLCARQRQPEQNKSGLPFYFVLQMLSICLPSR